MISTPTWINANSAMQYHTEAKDHYYQKEGELGKWQGRGAEALGFKHNEAITKEDLEKVLFGKDKEGNKVLNVRLDANNDRTRAALDLTFSAPKSVSIAREIALASNDTKLADAIKEAHEKAVEKILQRIEDNYSQTRVTENKLTQRVDTSNLAIAKFTHEVARPVSLDGKTLVDPSLHTHAVIMNMSQYEGKWRSLETKKIFENYIKEGTLYRAELANNLKELGFEIRITDAKKGFFELKNIDDKIIDEFSKRSEQIENIVEELKEQYPNKSETEIKQMAAWKSREWKGEIDRKAVLEDNKKRLENLGYNKDDILKRVEIKELTKEEKEQLKLQQNEIAKEAINNALEAVTSEKSVFSAEDVLEKAAKMTLKDQLPIDALSKAFDKNKNLIELTDNYFTTKEIIKAENSLIKALKNDKAVNSVFETKKEAKEKIEVYSLQKKEKTGYGLTRGQKEAATHILSKKDLIIGIQGDAGTGKTTMLKAVKELAGDTKLIGLSYTGKAASEIQKATASKETFNQAGIESQTIASFLRNIDKLDEKELADFKDSKLIVDEASMLGTKDAKKLLDFAKRTHSQIVLIGDTKQLKAIGAGSPFDLLQDNGMKTVRMSEVLRQKDETLKKAVDYLNKYDSSKAFEVLDKKGLIKESETAIEDVKKEFFKFDDRKNTEAIVAAKDSYKDNIILTNTNKMKDELNEAIREELKERGEIEKEDYKFLTRESTRLKPSEVFLTENYEKGNSVFIQKTIDDDLRAGKEFKIADINNDKNTIILTDNDEKIKKEVDLSKFGNHLQEYREVERDFSRGDKIVFTKNDKKLNVNNGETGIIKDISENGNLTVLKDNKEIKFNINEYSYLDYGYAITTHKSQGQTAKNVVAFMDSKSQNFNSFYVAVTRATDNLKIFTDNKEDLKEYIKVEQEKLNALEAKEKIATKETEWLKEQAGKIPATKKQLKTANNIAKALNLDFNETSKNKVSDFIEEHIKDYKEYLLNQPASDKQKDFANKISSTLRIDFEGETRKEVKEFIDKYSKDFTDYINDKTAYLTKINPSTLEAEQKEDYYQKFYSEMNRNIAKQDISNLDKQFQHLRENDPEELNILGKDLQIEAYEKAFRINNKDVIEKVADKYFGEDDFLKNFYTSRPKELAIELNNAGLNYNTEKDIAKAEIIEEKYDDYITDKMADAKDEKEFDNYVKQQDDLHTLLKDYKNEKIEELNYNKTVEKIEEHLQDKEPYFAAKLIEENRDYLREDDLKILEEKLEYIIDKEIEAKAPVIQKEIEEEEKYFQDPEYQKDFLENELDNYVDDLKNVEKEIETEENQVNNSIKIENEISQNDNELEI